ncbi:hypothetical protein C7999DRAFT_35619 [Corynascus novoguineensis]|uniref:GIT Spa2 homology (SHD) domain-containing protein n=1 Tax=Corynascus novoguineensis TaxID=1126955 RepID=A0AAN7CNL3_9PEZI|nr:hypothetical protein C7999DRAFT_35619 [Corynascus novoguineensis]
MRLIPTPLGAALEHLVASTDRISALVPPAFGLAVTTSAPDKEEDNENTQPNYQHSSGREGSGDKNGSAKISSSREERGRKRAARVRHALAHARFLLRRLQAVLSPLLGDRDAWEQASRTSAGERVRTNPLAEEAGALVVALGAGSVIASRLEAALERLVRLYEAEEHIKRCRREGRRVRGRDVERDVNVVRWMRHERREEIQDLVKGLQEFGMAVWFLLTILESPTGEDVSTTRASLWTAVTGMLEKNRELCKFIEKGAAMKVDSQSSSASDGSSTAENTPRSSIDTVLNRAEDSQNGSAVDRYIEDGANSDSDSEPGPPTPSSSVFSLPASAWWERKMSLNSFQSLDSILIPVATPTDPPDLGTTGFSLRNTADYESDSDADEPFLPQRRPSDPLKIVTISTAGVGISPLPEALNNNIGPGPSPDPSRILPQLSGNGEHGDTAAAAAAAALSANAIFGLPEVTDQVVLDFFDRAIRVSRFASRFHGVNGGDQSHTAASPSASQRQKLQGLRPRQLRELCTDLYDELVRRNVEDQMSHKGRNKSKTKDGRSPGGELESAKLEGLSAERACAKGRMVAMTDDDFARCMAAVIEELEMRCQVHASSQFAECEAAAAMGVKVISAGQGDP